MYSRDLHRRCATHVLGIPVPQPRRERVRVRVRVGGAFE